MLLSFRGYQLREINDYWTVSNDYLLSSTVPERLAMITSCHLPYPKG